MSTDASPPRCFMHGLAAGPDGRCVVCRRGETGATGGGRVVLVGLVILSLLVAAAIVYRGGRGLISVLMARGHAAAVEDSSPLDAPKGRVRLYTTAWCPHCSRAKQWLKAQHVDYEEVDLETTAGARSAHRKISPRGSIPTLDADGEVVVGFDAAAYRAAIQRAAKHAAP